jgi:hypothetical protein
MSNINIKFSRLMLATMHKTVKQHFPKITPMKDAYVWAGIAGTSWEFHGPNSFFLNGIRADNAYHARYKGWAAFLKNASIEDDKPETLFCLHCNLEIARDTAVNDGYCSANCAEQGAL